MKIKKFNVKDNREAMRLIRETLGPEAVILSNKTTKQGIEVIASDNFPEQEHSTADNDEVIDLNMSQDRFFKSLDNELKSIKFLLKEQLSNLVWDAKQRENPLQASIIRHLLECGFSSNIAHNISGVLKNTDSYERLWNRVNEYILKSLATVEESLNNKKNNIVIMLGASGSGKTTNIVKLASQYALRYGAQDIAFLNLDIKKIGSYEKLKSYANILKIPLRQIEKNSGILPAINYFKSKALVFVDTPTYSGDVEPLHELAKVFKEYSNVNFCLTLPATSQANVLYQTIEHYSMLPIKYGILSKIDEAVKLGEALSVFIEKKLPLQYISHGQTIPDDIELVDATKLIARALCKESNELYTLKDVDIARKYSEVIIDGIES